MNINKEQYFLTEELLQKTVVLRNKIENLAKSHSSKEIYIEILLDIEKVLSSHPVDIKRLRQDKIGLGRVVTNGDEDSPFGQDILLFHTAIHNYLKTIETLNKD